jgi:PHD/YefM family antitoxin component YafN of YafNO toxin-antitoxin module
MVTMHPSILKRNGKEAFAVLPYEEFLRIQDELEDYDDLKALRAAKAVERNAPSTSLRNARKKMGI